MAPIAETEAKPKGLTRDQLLAKATILKVLPVQLVEIGVVYLKEMTGSERDAFESSIVTMRGRDAQVNLVNARSKLLVRCLSDDAGVRMFKDNELELVGKIGAKALDLLFEAAQKLNGIGEKDIKDLTGDLGGAQGGASSSV